MTEAVEPVSPVGEQLDCLRAQGAARRDPLRWAFVEALARRSQGQTGAARALLDDRLAQALAAFLGGAPEPAPPPAAGPARHHLGGLLQALQAPAEAAPHVAAATTTGRSASGPAASPPAAPYELKALRYFRSSWAQLSVQQRLQQSQARLPAHAGPLNSQALALRALTLMQDISPAYLSHFMAHVDSLLWLDQARVRPAAAPTATGKPLRAKLRG
jgi:hypothetical protein